MKTYVLLFILTLAVYAVRIPIINTLPNRDAGAYLIVADNFPNIFPYKDIWDHHPPGIYLFNIVANFLPFSTLWDFWVLEIILFYSGILIAWHVLKQLTEGIPIIITLILGTTLYSILLKTGNFPEELTWLWQWLIIYVIYIWTVKKDFNLLNGFLMGFGFGVLWLIKPNLIALPLAAGLSLILPLFKNLKNKNRERWLYLNKILSFIKLRWKLGGLILITFIIINVLVLLIIYFKGALLDYMDQVWVYNMSYTNVSLFDRIKAIVAGLLVLSPLVSLFFISIILKKFSFSRNSNFWITIIFAFLLEMVLSSASGRIYPQYYLSWIPALCVLNLPMISIIHAKFRTRVLYYQLGIYFFLLLSTLGSNFYSIQRIQAKDETNITRMNSIKILNNTLVSNSPILFWGAEQSVQWLTGKSLASKYLYHYPLLSPSYSTESQIQSFVNDIRRSRPELIVDTSSTNHLIPPINPETRNVWNSENPQYQNIEYLKDWYEYIDSNYKLIYSISPGDWVVYQLKSH